MPKSTKLVPPTWRTHELMGAYTGKDFLEQTKELCRVELVDFDEFGLKEHVHEVPRGDYLMWYTLFNRGGVWGDLDILFLRPLDKLLEQDFDCAVSYIVDPRVGFFIAKPGEQIFLDLHERAKDIVRRNANDGYQSLGADVVRDLFPSADAVHSTYPESKILNLPMDIVYPYLPTAEIYEIFFQGPDRTTENTVGIHWYNGNFIAKEYQNNFELYRNNESVISRYIKQVESV